MKDLSVYVLVSFIACVTPGSGVLYTVTNGLRGGLRTVLASPLGTTLGVGLMSLMPQFISPEDDYVSRVTLLSVLFVGICFLVHLGYSAIAAVARKWLAGPNFSIWLNRVSGALFWLLGLSVIWNALFNR